VTDQVDARALPRLPSAARLVAPGFGLVVPIAAVVVLVAAVGTAEATDRGFLAAAAVVAGLAGLSATSIGVFGGVLVPGLLLLGVEPRVAAPLSLFLQVLVIPIGATGHHVLGNVRRSVAAPLLVGGVGGAVGGALVATSVSQDVVARGVGLVIVVIGIIVLASLRPGRPAPTNRTDPGARPIGIIGAAAGFASGISGAGWGPIGVKLLLLRGVEPRFAIGSSLVGRVFMALAAIATYAITASTIGLPADTRLVVVLLAATLATMFPGTLLISRVGRRPATIVLVLISIGLALPALLFGAG
jgi:uncharacterized membrane protein YfcA